MPKESQDHVQVQLLWQPVKQEKLFAQLHIYKSPGGRWKFDVELYAEEPDVDGVVICEAHIDCSISVPVEVFAPGVPV